MILDAELHVLSLHWQKRNEMIDKMARDDFGMLEAAWLVVGGIQDYTLKFLVSKLLPQIAFLIMPDRMLSNLLATSVAKKKRCKLMLQMTDFKLTSRREICFFVDRLCR